MTSEDRATQFKVGTFIFIGLVTVGVMVVYFGRMGESFSSYYNLRVEFPNASGLVNGAEVQLAGARIGRVTSSPTMLASMEGIYVNVRILQTVKIPDTSEFLIESNGLLGDKYVEIRLKPNAKNAPPIKPNSTVKGGEDSGGFAGIADSASKLLPDIKASIEKLNSIAQKIDTGVLSPDGIRAISESVKNIQLTSATLVVASGKIEGVVAKVDKTASQADGAIAAGKEAMDAGKKAADELQRALADIRSLVRDVKTGQGVLGALISNKEMSENLRLLISNLKKYGILWYKDGEKTKSVGSGR